MIPAADQVRKIASAAGRAKAGDTVVIHSGIYREAVSIERSGTAERPILFEAAPAAEVTITGLDLLTGLQKENDNIYSLPWTYNFIPWSKTGAHPDDEYHRLIGRAEQVLVNGYPLQQTLEREHLGRGGFFVDTTAQRLYISPATAEPIGAVQVEASTRRVLWDCKGAFVITRGLRFRYAANNAQQGAVVLNRRGDVVEDCVFERMNSAGAAFLAPDQVARHCTFHDNGQLGFTANHAHNLLVTGCIIRSNNTKNFSRQWEAGGDKIVLSRGVVLEKNQFVANRGSGIWFDMGNEDCIVRNCFIAENEDAGIFYEISRGLIAHDNVIIGNGTVPDPAAWGGQAGISISSSPDCRLFRNLVIANKEGVSFREQERATPRIGRETQPEEKTTIARETISHNVIAYNREAQIAGWFAVGDERHWPRAMQASDDAARQEGISLETLNIRLRGNVYAVADAQPLILWGPIWMRHTVYSDLQKVRAELHLDQGGRVAGMQFANYAQRNFRVPTHSPALLLDCYPHGVIPGVSVGTMATKR